MELDPIPPEAAAAIEAVRRLTRSLADKSSEHSKGDRVDVLLGIAYGLNDLACDMVGHPIGAIEWLRTCVDLFERQHMERNACVARPH